MDLGQLGATLEAEPYLVTPAAMIAYARATNDANLAHLAGELAPPLFAVVPALRTMARAKTLVTDQFTLHAAHQIEIAQPIVAGMILRVRAVVIGIHPTPAGALVVVRGETRDGETLVNVQHLVVLRQGEQIAAGMGETAPDHRTPDGVVDGPAEIEIHEPLDPDQTRRYAEASGDRSDYTFDAEAARAKGLAGPIVHGLCTMAFLGRAVTEQACGGDSRRLRRLACRFTRPLIMEPGQMLTTRLWRLPAQGRIAVRRYAAICLDRDGVAVVRHGLAELGE